MKLKILVGKILNHHAMLPHMEGGETSSDCIGLSCKTVECNRLQKSIREDPQVEAHVKVSAY